MGLGAMAGQGPATCRGKGGEGEGEGGGGRGNGMGRDLQGGEEVQAQGQQQVAPQLGFPGALLRHLRPSHVL